MAEHSEPALLIATALRKRLGGHRVVDGVDLHVRPGQVLALLGPNGAGKTTTLRMLYGFLEADGGEIRCPPLGGDLRSSKRWIGVCTQEDTYDHDFTVRRNLHIAAGYFRPAVPELDARVETLLRRFGLLDFATRMPETLSGGYRRRLLIARALVHRPRILFLDEPTTGLDPQARVALWQLIAELRDEGLGIVLTTHYMDEAERLSDRLVLLREGRVVADDRPRAVLGALLGEHIAVLRSDHPALDRVRGWLTERGRGEPRALLGEWHLPLAAEELPAFTKACGDIDFELRRPTLDDLFLQMSESA